jgi:hypothetical protein|tara:strand:- start:1785 stop:2837 length:1053 start_codon:yes stop_codon:yes gene_type:complete
VAEPEPLVSVVIPHWNGIEVLAECLESLYKSSYPNMEVVVVDNASTDGSPEWIVANHGKVNLVRCRENRGYAGGCNLGAEYASGDYLLFLNNDTVHTPDWIELLVATLEKNRGVAAVQPKILNYFEKELFDYAGGSGGQMDILCFPFARGRLFLTREEDSGQYDDETDIFWASGTAFLVRKSVFEEVGGFDETFFAHQEEIDLQWRIHLAGLDVVVNPASVVYHRNAVTLTMHSPQKKYLNHRNSLLMMLSNYSLPMALYLFPIRLILEFIAVLYALVLVDFGHVAAIFRSLFWILFHPHVIHRRRKRTRSVRCLKDRAILAKLYRGSVVLDYYILGKRSYSDLMPSPSR